MILDDGILSKLLEITSSAGAGANDAISKAVKSLTNLTSAYGINPNLYASTATSSSILEEGNWGCDNPYGDGKDPEYICPLYSEGKCLASGSSKCKERYSMESLDD